MTPEFFDDTLERFMKRQPFAPFMVELNGGERFEVDHAHAVTWREGRAAFLGPGGILQLFDSQSVLQFIDAPAHAIRSKRPKK